MFKNKYKIPLLEVVLDILHPVHPLLDLQVDLSIMKMVPNDFTCQKTLGFRGQRDIDLGLDLDDSGYSRSRHRY